MLREIDSYIFVSLIICINQKKNKICGSKGIEGETRRKMGRLTKARKCCVRWPWWLAGWIEVSNQSWRRRTHRCGRLFACKRGHTDENCKGERRGGCRNIKTKVKKKETFPWTRGKMNPVLDKNSITNGGSTATLKEYQAAKKGYQAAKKHIKLQKREIKLQEQDIKLQKRRY